MGKRYSRKRDNGDRQDVYERVTATIVEQLEKGVRPWCKPWAGGHVAGPRSSAGKLVRGTDTCGLARPGWWSSRRAPPGAALGDGAAARRRRGMLRLLGRLERQDTRAA